MDTLPTDSLSVNKQRGAEKMSFTEGISKSNQEMEV